MEKQKLPRKVDPWVSPSFLTNFIQRDGNQRPPLFLKPPGREDQHHGLIEGVAESHVQLPEAVFGLVPDRLYPKRKLSAVIGYGISALSSRCSFLPIPGKSSPPAVRWGDRVRAHARLPRRAGGRLHTAGAARLRLRFPPRRRYRRRLSAPGDRPGRSSGSSRAAAASCWKDGAGRLLPAFAAVTWS